MLSNSMKQLNRPKQFLQMDDMSNIFMAGRSASHRACWKYLQMDLYDSALEQAQLIINREPDMPDGYVFKARALFRKGHYYEAEEVLIKVMDIAEQKDLIRCDVEGMVKLKDELANSRVEILRRNKFREPNDIAEMHWNDCHKPILELIGFTTPTRGGGGDKSDPMDVDMSIIDIIGVEKAKQLYPHLLIDSPPNKSTPISRSFSNYSQRHSTNGSTGFSNLNLSGEFPHRDKGRTSATISGPNTSKNSGRDEDLDDFELRTAALKTALLLAEEKNVKSEMKIKNLEEELKKVYESVLKLNNENKSLDKKCNTLISQLDKVVGKGQSFLPTRREPDPDVQILREVAANKRKRALNTLRNPYRRFTGARNGNRTGLLSNPAIRKAKQNLAQNKREGLLQRPMVFTNSNRKGQWMDSLVREEYEMNKELRKHNTNQSCSSAPYMRSVPNLSMRSEPTTGPRFRDTYVSPTQEYRNSAPNYNSLEYLRRPLEFQATVSTASRRYPPGILPAQSYLSSVRSDSTPNLYNRFNQF